VRGWVGESAGETAGETVRRHAGWLAPLCWGLVVVLDGRLFTAPDYLALGVIDEPAHFLTSAIVVLALSALLGLLTGHRLPSAFVLGALLAGNLIDADHVPQVLGHDFLTVGTPRPYPHSITTVLVLLSLAGLARWLWPRRAGLPVFLAGASLGVSGHLFRDTGTASVALGWPLTRRGFACSHGMYMTGLLILALIPVVAALLNRLPALRRWSRSHPERLSSTVRGPTRKA
jgi:hypothetical protein